MTHFRWRRQCASQTSRHLVLILAAALTVVLVSACRRQNVSGGAQAGSNARRSIGARIGLPADESARLVHGGSGSAVVRFQPNVRIIERDEALAALAGVSSDGATLLFEPAGPRLHALQAGDVLVIKGLLARKVLAVDVQGAAVAALTVPASLGEVIRQGHIEVHAPLRFTPAISARTGGAGGERLGALLALTVPELRAQAPDAERLNKAEKEGTIKVAKDAVKGIFGGWATTYSAVPGQGRMDLSLEMSKQLGGFKGLVTGTGYIADFDVSSKIDVEEGVVQQLQATYKRLNGVMNFTWEIGKDSPGGYSEEDRVKLPGAITIPLYQFLDGFPLFLEVGAAIIVQPVITGGMQYGHGAFRVTYDGAQGFRARKGTVDSDGQVRGDIKLIEHRHISAVAPVGMVLNLAAPRLELTLDPLKALAEVSGGGLQKQMEKAAAKVDRIAEQLMKRTLGDEAAERVQRSGLSMKKATEAMKSNALAYIQLVTTNAVTNSGLSVITPCTHTDLAISVSVGAAAQAFGQKVVPRTGKTVFERKLTLIDPRGHSTLRLLNDLTLPAHGERYGQLVILTRKTSWSFPRFLADPRVDRTVAVIASLPAGYLICWRLRQGTLDIVRINLILQSLLFIVTMIVRRPPVRVTLNPWFWLLAFVATYWIPSRRSPLLLEPRCPTLGHPHSLMAWPSHCDLCAPQPRPQHRPRPCAAADCHDRSVRSRSAPDLHRRVHQLHCAPVPQILSRDRSTGGSGHFLVPDQESGRRALSPERPGVRRVHGTRKAALDTRDPVGSSLPRGG